MDEEITNKLEMEFFSKANKQRYKHLKAFLFYGVFLEDCEGRITSDFIEELQPSEIFVFGSNLAGKHGKGAAKLAAQKFGAEYGVGVGPTGRCYAIPTKDENLKPQPLLEIERWVNNFTLLAERRPDKTFLVTEIGCGLAGYSPEQIAPMFEEAIKLENVHLPLSFWQVLGKMKINKQNEEE